MTKHQLIGTEVLELQELTDPARPITYGVVKPGPEDPETGVLFIRGGDISNGSINEANLRTITQEVSRPYARTILRGGEVIMSLVGNPGEVAVVPDRLAGANLARQAGLIALRPEVHAPYIKYYLMAPHGRGELFQRTQGAVQQVINLSDLKRVKVRLPAGQIQQRIANILSAYDDLIENNRRRIQLLEQAAQLLYKEWFVHLRFPGHEHFKIVNGVPEGWEKGVVNDFYDTASGGTPSRKNPEFYDGHIKWVKTQELQDGFLFDTEEHITEDAIKKSAAKLFPSNTVLIAMYGATIGQVGVIVEPSTCNQACCAIMPKSEGTSYEHAFLFFLSNKEGLRNLGQGAAQKNISQQVIRGYEMILPDKLILKLFRNNAETYLRQIRNLQAMNRKLAKVRDLLLPRLMNGEISV
jgi:type I restriction enzyme S subunit